MDSKMQFIDRVVLIEEAGVPHGSICPALIVFQHSERREIIRGLLASFALLSIADRCFYTFVHSFWGLPQLHLPPYHIVRGRMLKVRVEPNNIA